MVAIGVLLAVLGPDLRRAPDVELALAARIQVHSHGAQWLEQLKCLRTGEPKIYSCDGVLHGVAIAPAPLHFRVTAPSSSPNS